MRRKTFLILLFFVLGLIFYQIKRARSSLWEGNSRIGFVFASEPVVVVSLQPGKSLTALSLPDNLYLEVSRGYGQYPLGSVYKLGELEGKGGELLRETVQEYLGVPVDGYLKMTNDKWPMTNDKKFILSCLSLILRGREETNLSQWDLLRLWWEIRKLRSDKVKFIGFSGANVLTPKSLPDGSEVLETEFFRLDEMVKRYFSDSKIEKEGYTIEVLNSTEHPRLANKVARLVTNMGGNIVAMGNAEFKIQNSKFKIQKKEILKNYTVRKLEKILGIKAEVGEMGESRADLLILLGEDYWEKWYNK